MVRRIRVIVALATIVVISTLSETSLRFLGVLDFPLYRESPDVGYYLEPNQTGTFLRKNTWFVNRDGLNNDQPFIDSKPYTILVGDSVVYGGNPVDYKSRIGYFLSKETSQNVWVAAVGGWSLLNELAYISRLGKIVNSADRLVIVYDNGDLDGLSRWGGELIHPTRKPFWAIGFVFEKYILPKFGISSGSELPPIPSAVSQTTNSLWMTELNGLLERYKGKILFVLYPDKLALADSSLWQMQTQEIRNYIAAHSERIDLVDVAKIPQWSSALYRDGIHPNVDGNRVLALKISEWITSAE